MSTANDLPVIMNVILDDAARDDGVRAAVLAGDQERFACELQRVANERLNRTARLALDPRGRDYVIAQLVAHFYS